ncbi:MAG: ABC transporter ATP-binding protein [Nitrososphaerales archaeon]
MSLQIEDIHVDYAVGQKTIPALDGLSLEIPLERYTIGVVGESGSGKTTLGMSIMGAIESPGRIASGTIKYDGVNILAFSKKEMMKYQWEQVSMIYQSAMNSLHPVKRVRDPIIEVLREHRHTSKKEATAIALKLLSEVGIKKERAGDYPHEFSGGMRQRVIIALALALSPKLLIADEPTSALDVVTQRQILSLLKKKVANSGLSLLFITHEISVLSGLVDNIAVMYAGEIAEKGPLDEVFVEPLHPYTEMLLSTLITVDSEPQLGPKSSGGVKVAFDRTAASGAMCKYVNRCKYAFNRCKVERPILREARKGRWVACHRWN